MAIIYYPTSTRIYQREVVNQNLTELSIGIQPDQILVLTGSTFFTSSLSASYASTSNIASSSSYSLTSSYSLSSSYALNTRNTLTAATSYYVTGSGNDNNDGLSITSPFKTIAKAISTAQSIDTKTYNVTIYIYPGLYYENISITGRVVGAGTITMMGIDPTSASLTIISGSNGSSAIIVSDNSTVFIRDLTLTNGTGNTAPVLRSTYGGNLTIQGGIIFSSSYAHIWPDNFGMIRITGLYSGAVPYHVIGSCSYHIFATNCGLFRGGGSTAKISSSVAILWVVATKNSLVDLNGTTFVSNSKAYGSQYDVSYNSTYYANTPTVLGTVTGVTSTGGQYV